MSKLPRDEIERIIERDAPGHTLATPPEAEPVRSVRVEPDESAPDIAALRKKYLGESPPQAGPDAPPGDAPEADAGEAADDDEIVAVKPSAAGDPFDHDFRPKTIVISGKDKKVIGSQG